MRKTVWIDLDNSPHVPFFAPIMKELERNGYRVFLTVRDCAQTCALADLFHFQYQRVGHHYGKHKVFKAWGTMVRAYQLQALARPERPAIAISHGSRSQLVATAALGIPSVMIFDYEFASHMPGISPTWAMMPAVIPTERVPFPAERILQYPGIKEDVYVPSFRYDTELRRKLNIDAEARIITIRPPASEAHYHNPESEALFEAVIDQLCRRPNTKLVLLPRNDRQAELLRESYPALISEGTMIIPERVVDGLSLIWESDAVVSGGGTMNREAAAMGVPVYSIFRGPTGAVDRYLAENGRLIMLQSVDDVKTKLEVHPRKRPDHPQAGSSETLGFIVDNIIAITGKTHHKLERKTA